MSKMGRFVSLLLITMVLSCGPKDKDEHTHIDNSSEIEKLQSEIIALKEQKKRRFEQKALTKQKMSQQLFIESSHIQIDGDRATWHNKWMAAGNEITWEMLHYDVQLIGGIVLHQGKIAEMATGEGKTLVATLPAYLNALAGRGVHVITVNDYLAKRDALELEPLYNFLGFHASFSEG